jgi:hypothetical protein
MLSSHERRQLAELERQLRTDDPDLVRKFLEGVPGRRLSGRPGRDRLLEVVLGLLILLGAVAILLGSATGAMLCVLAAAFTAHARYRRRKPARPSP